MIVLDRKFYNRSIRERLGLSVLELAQRVEVTRQTIHNYEIGRYGVFRPLERVIELELDKAITECGDSDKIDICIDLRERRDGRV